MIVKFEKEYLAELYYTRKCSDKKHRYQPQVIKNYIKRIITLAETPNIEALFPINSLNYEVLKGDKQGVSSIRIDKQYRLEFIVSNDASAGLVVTVCRIIDITNHYK